MGTVVGRAWWVLVAGALVAAGCSSDDDAGSAAPDPPAATDASAPEPIEWPEPVFVEGECPMPITDEVEVTVTCGTVDVPENRLDPDSATITLAVARLHSRSADPAPDPVVQLEGGPGFPSLEDVEGYSRSAVLDDRDYILWDQRGTGFTSPNLDCTESNEAVWEVFGTTDEAEVEYAVLEDSLRACRARLDALEVDFDGYDTTQNAADLDDVRRALGIDEWNLRGISYGSALAIEAIRNHPEGIRSALLDSIVPPDAGFGAVGRGESALASFEELYAACADDEFCSSEYGDLQALFQEAAERLDAEPHRTEVTDPATGTVYPVAITGQDLWAGLFNAMYDETLIPALPSAARSISNGDTAIIDLLAEQGIPFAAGQHEAMTASITCADRSRLLDADRLEPFLDEHPELAALVYLLVPETGCDEWGVERQPDAFNELLGPDTEVPTIVMAGRFDPITPVEGSQRVADALGKDLILFPNAGHGGVSSSACARDLWLAFLDDPTVDPDTSCIAELGPPEFT